MGIEKSETAGNGYPKEGLTLEEEIRLVDLIYPLFKWRWLIVLVVIVTVSVAALFTARSPRIYEAKAVIIPETEGGEDVGLRASLAQQLGVNVLGQKSGLSTTLTNVLNSRPFAERVAERLNYAELAGLEGGSEPVSPEIFQRGATEALREAVRVDQSETVTIRVTAQDPLLAAHIANTYVAELAHYNKESNVTKAKRLRLFLEERLAQANQELVRAQKDLRTFQEQHKALSISEQAKQTLSTLANLEAKKLELEVQLAAQEQFIRESHIQVKSLQAQIAALQKNIDQLKYADVMAHSTGSDGTLAYYVPLDQVPLLSFQESRLLLEVETKSKVVELLTTQLEQAKLDEARELPTITVLEPAVVPGGSIKPKMKLNLMLATVMGLFGGMMLAFVVAYFEQEAKDKEHGSKWEEMRQGLHRDFRRVTKLGKGYLWLSVVGFLTACNGVYSSTSVPPKPLADDNMSISLFAAGYGDGVYQSTNGGKTWTPLTLAGMEISHYFKVLALNSGPSPTLYVGTTGQGLYQITLDAEKGPVALQRLRGVNVKAILADPTDPDRLYAATWGQGVMKSRDGGRSWESFNEGLIYLYVRTLAIAPTTPATLYAGTVGGVFRLPEGHTQWEPISKGLEVLNVKALAVDPESPQVVYAGTSAHKERGSLYRTLDGGNSWRVLEEGPKAVTVFTIVLDAGAGQKMLAGTAHGVMASRDGKKWKEWSAGLPKAPVYSLVLTQEPLRAVFAATHGGVYRRLKGEESWRPLRYGLEGEMITALISVPSDGLAQAAGVRKEVNK